MWTCLGLGFHIQGSHCMSPGRAKRELDEDDHNPVGREKERVRAGQGQGYGMGTRESICEAFPRWPHWGRLMDRLWAVRQREDLPI